jgi:hypothetical protein
MNSTLSERWARSILTRTYRGSHWLCWGAAALFLAVTLYNLIGSTGWDRATFSFLMGVMWGLQGMVWWERGGFRRLVAAKDAEIARLRNALAAAPPPNRIG